jgi:hypothetical protein
VQPEHERVSCGEFVDTITAQNMHTKVCARAFWSQRGVWCVATVLHRVATWCAIATQIFALLSKVNFDCRAGLSYDEKMQLLQVARARGPIGRRACDTVFVFGTGTVRYSAALGDTGQYCRGYSAVLGGTVGYCMGTVRYCMVL